MTTPQQSAEEACEMFKEKFCNTDGSLHSEGDVDFIVSFIRSTFSAGYEKGTMDSVPQQYSTIYDEGFSAGLQKGREEERERLEKLFRMYGLSGKYNEMLAEIKQNEAKLEKLSALEDKEI